LGCQGGFGCRFGILVGSDRKVFINDLYLFKVIFDHLIEERRQSRTVRSLEFTENGNNDRCILDSLKGGT